MIAISITRCPGASVISCHCLERRRTGEARSSYAKHPYIPRFFFPTNACSRTSFSLSFSLFLFYHSRACSLHAYFRASHTRCRFHLLSFARSLKFATTSDSEKKMRLDRSIAITKLRKLVIIARVI